MSTLKQKIKQKILNKWTLSLQDKIFLEKLENISEKELINQLLVKKLNKIKLLIENLEQKKLYWKANEKELEQLELLIEKKKEIINKIRELRKEEELTIKDFGQTNNVDILNFNWFDDFLGSVWDKIIESAKEEIKDNIIDISIDSILIWLFN